MTKRTGLVLFTALLISGCGPGNGTSSSNPCEPTTPASVEITGDPNRRFEDIIEYLTGERESTDEDVSVEDQIDDPNFGGVWGDFKGGVVVAVLDCSKVNANRLAEMAGGADSLHLIEVPYTFRQVEEFSDALVATLRDLGIQGDVNIDSTLHGRVIEVHVRDASVLPPSFGSDVPDDAYEVIESETVGTLEG